MIKCSQGTSRHSKRTSDIPRELQIFPENCRCLKNLKTFKVIYKCSKGVQNVPKELQVLPGISIRSHTTPYVPRDLQMLQRENQMFPGILKSSRKPQMFPRDLQLFPRTFKDSQLLQILLWDL